MAKWVILNACKRGGGEGDSIPLIPPALEEHQGVKGRLTISCHHTMGSVGEIGLVSAARLKEGRMRLKEAHSMRGLVKRRAVVGSAILGDGAR